MKIVHVKWYDPCSGGDEWIPKEEFEEWAEEDFSLIESVGFLFSENEKFIVLATNLMSGEDARSTGGFKILRSVIESMKTIGETAIEGWDDPEL